MGSNEINSLPSPVIVNRIPGLREIAQKKNTGMILNKFREYFP